MYELSPHSQSNTSSWDIGNGQSTESTNQPLNDDYAEFVDLTFLHGRSGVDVPS